jgi:hypothetical protein
MNDKDIFHSFWDNVILKNFPDAKIVYKDKSLLMKIVYYTIIWIFNRTFMTRYVTVIGTTVYFPSREWLARRYHAVTRIIAHEFVHMVDNEKDAFQPIKYLSPQIWALFSLFAFLGFANSWFLLFLCTLVFLLPFPSPWRTDYEGNGYAMTMYFTSQEKPDYDAERDAKHLSKQFTTSMYYWMCRNESKVIAMLLDRYETLPKTHWAFKEVSQWLKTLKR